MNVRVVLQKIPKASRFDPVRKVQLLLARCHGKGEGKRHDVFVVLVKAVAFVAAVGRHVAHEIVSVRNRVEVKRLPASPVAVAISVHLGHCGIRALQAAVAGQELLEILWRLSHVLHKIHLVVVRVKGIRPDKVFVIGKDAH